MKTYILIIALQLFNLTLFAQLVPKKFMDLVKNNHPGLIVAKQKLTTDIAGAKTGLTPYDPEVELGYLIGTPDELGNRTDFSITQEFDFPTTYIYQKKKSRSQIKKVKTEYLLIKQEILLIAQQSWIKYAAISSKLDILTKRKEIINKLNDDFKTKFNAGEINILELNNFNLKTTSFNIEYAQLKNQWKNTQLELSRMTGSDDYNHISTKLPNSMGISFDSLQIDYQNSATIQYYQNQSDLAIKEKQITGSQNLPKLMAGYYSESILDEKFNGFKAGITIPLWHNKGLLKQAKAKINENETELNSVKNLQLIELRKKIESYKNVTSQINELQDALNVNLNDQLLNKAIESGEINLNDYFIESDLFYQSQTLLIDLQKEQLILELDLKKIYL